MNGLSCIAEYSENLEITYEERLEFIQKFYKGLKDQASEKGLEIDESKYISDELSNKLIEYLKYLEIPRFDLNFKEQDKIKIVLGFCKVLSTIRMMQFRDFMILKYRQSIAITGFHKLAKVCRGKVINIKTHKIVSYPYDKFYNLNENSDYSYTTILKLMEEASDVEVTEKFDGSLISIVKTDKQLGNFGEQLNILVTSMGSFQGDQVQIAESILNYKYSEFIKYLGENDDNKTYIFEVIQPKDAHVVDYGGLEDLILTGIRDLDTYEFLSYDSMNEIAKKLKLRVTPILEDINIENYLEESRKTGVNKEGWVFRLRFKDRETFMFKLKYSEYFQLSRQKADIPMQKVYGMLKSGHFIDWYNTLSDSEKDSVIELQEDINVGIGQIENYIKRWTLDIIHKHIENEQEFKFSMLNVDEIKAIASDKSKMGKFVITCLKNRDSFQVQYKNLGFEDFIQMLDYINND